MKPKSGNLWTKIWLLAFMLILSPAGAFSQSLGKTEIVKLSIARAIHCPKHFVGVPGNEFYGTSSFCVMKYEAKQDPTDQTKAISQPLGTPWVEVNRAQAVAACQASGYDLITNDQWQTIARNIEKGDENWAHGEMGNAGGLNRGHSDGQPFIALAASGDDSQGCAGTISQADTLAACQASGDEVCASKSEERACHGTGRSQKRTHIVSNNGEDEVIWDMAGNAWEWVKDNNGTWDGRQNIGGSDYGIADNAYISQLPVDSTKRASLTGGTTAVPRTAKNQFGPSGDYSHLNSGELGGLGYFFGGTGGGVLRGGNWLYGHYAGVFAAYLFPSPSVSSSVFGFRCVTSRLAVLPHK